jgi:Ca2+-binding EF-hand superfamily protein
MFSIVCALALAAGPSRPAGDVQDLVYLAPTGPVLIRLHLRAEGQPLRARYEALMREIFNSLDKNKDGFLDAKEAAAMPQLSGRGPFFIGGNFIGRQPVRLAGGEVRLSFEGMKERYAQQGIVPFSLATGGGNFVYLAGLSEPRTAAQITARLFSKLDTNKDGKLDAKELAAAERVLLEFDANEDELVGVDELMDEPSAPAGGLAVVSYRRGAVESVPGFYPASDRLSLAAIAQELSKPGASLGRFRELDTNRDGKLSAAEMAGLAALTPDVEVNVEVDAKGGVAVSITPSTSPTKGVGVRQSGKSTVVKVGKVEITLGSPPATRGGVFRLVSDDNYKRIFKRLDADGNGYLDRKEAMRIPTIGNQFDAMDADHDGKVFEKEFLAYMKHIQALTEKARGATMSLSVSEEGQGLFDLLDLNGDGVLSVREMRRAPEVLKRLKVEQLTVADVPRQFHAGFSPGGASGPNFGAFRVVNYSGMRRPTPRTAEKGPEWFRRMDRNRDGDVSRSEWLGTTEEFDRIDTDHDGLISLAEAEAYHKKVIEKKEKR